MYISGTEVKMNSSSPKARPTQCILVNYIYVCTL